MSRRATTARRRTARLLALLIAGALALTACGDDGGEGSVETADGLSAVTISGDFGSEPKVEWKARMQADDLESEVLVEGDGAELRDGDQVFTRMILGNGYSQTTVYSTFGKDAQPDVLPVGDDLSAALKEALEGHALGTRVAVAAPPDDAFGEGGNPELGIGNADPVLFVVDLVDTLPSSPDGAEQNPAGWAPKVNEKDDKPESFDFKGTPKPDGKLRVTTLIEGTGEKAENGQTVYVNYLGQVYDGRKPFDSSYAKGQPFPFTLGKGEVVKGWDRGLQGIPVGSRVIIAIPPRLGYGEQGNEQAGIKGTDTLYFVVDLLAAL